MTDARELLAAELMRVGRNMAELDEAIGTVGTEAIIRAISRALTSDRGSGEDTKDGRVPSAPGSREPSPEGFDPSREGLSDGAIRALMRHTREDGELSDFVLGEGDAEELWFCSMLRVVSGRLPLVTRTSWTSGFGGGTTYYYTLTPLGRMLHEVAVALSDSDRSGEAVETTEIGSTEGESAGRSEAEASSK